MPRPFRAWAAAQWASAWNRTERGLRRGWHVFLKGAFLVLQDDADLYVGLWGRAWSWIWPLAPLVFGGLVAATMLVLWSFQISVQHPAAGPWWRLPELLGLLGFCLGLAAQAGGSPPRLLEQPWPLTRLQLRWLRLAGPFLHPASLLALISGLAAAAPWAFHAKVFAAVLLALPVAAFRVGLAAGFFSPLAAGLLRRRSHSGAPASLDAFFKRAAGNSGAGMAGWLLAIPLLLSGRLILGFSALGFGWAMVQTDLLRLEGRGAALVASFPMPPSAKLDARLRGVARWSAPTALAAWTALGLRLGPISFLPGGIALLGMHLTGDALGLRASASAPLAGGSPLALQALGLTTLCGGTAWGWLFASALRDPAALVLQASLVLAAWLALQRVRSRVVEDWASIQEGLIQP